MKIEKGEFHSGKNPTNRIDAVTKPLKPHYGFEALASEDIEESPGREDKEGEGNGESSQNTEGLEVVVEGHALDGGGGRPLSGHGYNHGSFK